MRGLEKKLEHLQEVREQEPTFRSGDLVHHVDLIVYSWSVQSVDRGDAWGSAK